MQIFSPKFIPIDSSLLSAGLTPTDTLVIAYVATRQRYFLGMPKQYATTHVVSRVIRCAKTTTSTRMARLVKEGYLVYADIGKKRVYYCEDSRLRRYTRHLSGQPVATGVKKLFNV